MKHHAMPHDARSQLLAMQAQLRERLERLERDRRRHGEPLPADFADQAGECENDEVVDALTVGTRTSLAQLDRALQRGEAGLWSICERCGKTIDAARLKKMPEVTLCAACADQG